MGLYLKQLHVQGAQLQKGNRGKATVLTHCDNHLLKAVLSSVSKQAMKTAKIGHFLFIGLCGTVVMNREASELQLGQPCLD